MRHLSQHAVQVFAQSFSALIIAIGALALASTTTGIGHSYPAAGRILAIAAFWFAFHHAVAVSLGQLNSGHLARALILRRDARQFIVSTVGIATAVWLIGAVALSWTLDADPVVPHPLRLVVMVALQATIAIGVFSRMTDPVRAVARVQRAECPYRAKPAASRASAVMPAQSPLTIFPLGATQLPPTQTVFGKDR